MPYLYVLKCQAFYKIGVATNLSARVASLQTGSPYRLDVVRYYEFDNPIHVEQALHGRFATKNERLEWFSLSDSDIAAIDDICYLLGGKRGNEIIEVTEQEASGAEAIGVLSDDTSIADKVAQLKEQGARIEAKPYRNKDGTQRIYYVARFEEKGENGERVRRSVYIGKA